MFHTFSWKIDNQRFFYIICMKRLTPILLYYHQLYFLYISPAHKTSRDMGDCINDPSRIFIIWSPKHHGLHNLWDWSGSSLAFLCVHLFLWFSSMWLATRGSPLLSVIGIKTTPNYAILRCFLATGTLYLLPKPLRQRYSGLTVCPDTALTLPS